MATVPADEKWWYVSVADGETGKLVVAGVFSAPTQTKVISKVLGLAKHWDRCANLLSIELKPGDFLPDSADQNKLFRDREELGRAFGPLEDVRGEG